MRTPITPATKPRRRAGVSRAPSTGLVLFHTALRAILIVAADSALQGCRAAGVDAGRLRDDCETGNAQACNELGFKLLKGEYVLRDEPRAARRFASADHLSLGVAIVTCAIVFGGFLLLSVRRLRRMDVP